MTVTSTTAVSMVLLTVPQVAEEIPGASEQTVRRMAEGGKFPGAFRFHRGGWWRIPKSDVRRFLDSVRPFRRRRVG